MKRKQLHRRAKIVATLGPSTSTKSILTKLLAEGVNVMRLNFAHGTHEEHASRIAMIRQVAGHLGVPVGILMDLPGPKLRVGRLPDSAIEVRRDEIVNLAHKNSSVPGKLIPISYPRLTQDLKPGHVVFIADGLIRLSVDLIEGQLVRCRVTHGGTIRSGNGVNMPNSSLTLNAFTKDDKKHLAFGLRHHVDFIGISFVGHAKDIRHVRSFCRQRGANPFLIAKIERRMALKNLDSIVQAADGLMVARGDLGVEVPFSDIPGLQETIVASSRQYGKPVIVATQVLESMVHNPRPTRAEATDIANAILEGTDAIMLSGETAAGKYPVESVRALRHVIEATEKDRTRTNKEAPSQKFSLSEVVAHEACHIADRIGARLLVVPSGSGESVARVSRYRPATPILALTPDGALRQRLSLTWGVRTFPIKRSITVQNRRLATQSLLLKHRLARRGDAVVIVCSDPPHSAGHTSLVQAFEI